MLFIPRELKMRLKGGYNTYTGNKAYIIYKDHLGVWRKENSWNNWYGAEPEVTFFNNEPMEGFVIDKNDGGVNSGWSSFDTRKEKAVVYDPRGFEIEITIPNLFNILKAQGCGKGGCLLGKFVYVWEDKELGLMPIESEKYREVKASSDSLLDGKALHWKELIPGREVKDKHGNILIYVGKYKLYLNCYVHRDFHEQDSKYSYCFYYITHDRDGKIEYRFEDFRNVKDSFYNMSDETSIHYEKILDLVYNNPKIQGVSPEVEWVKVGYEDFKNHVIHRQSIFEHKWRHPNIEYFHIKYYSGKNFPSGADFGDVLRYDDKYTMFSTVESSYDSENSRNYWRQRLDKKNYFKNWGGVKFSLEQLYEVYDPYYAIEHFLDGREYKRIGYPEKENEDE